VQFWPSKDDRLPQLDHFRRYYAEELYPSEKVWLPAVFEPVKAAYLTFPQPLEIYLPEEALPEDAQLAYLVGKQPEQGGVWREIFVYRARRMVQIYRIQSHGRRFYRSLEYTTDARFTLRAMQPSTDHRSQLWPSWARHEAGHPYASSYSKPSSAVITRDWTVEQNLSLGTETYIPSRLLWGMVPQVLLELYVFWQDESDQLRGYPHSAATDGFDDVILVRIGAGAHVTQFGSRFDRVRLAEHALTPTRALVLRLKASRLHEQREAVMAALEVLESFLRSSGVLEGAFEPSFTACQALLSFTDRLGTSNATDEIDDSAAGSEAVGAEEMHTAMKQRIDAHLKRIDLTPFHRRRKHHRTAAAVVPAVIDAAVELLVMDAKMDTDELAVADDVTAVDATEESAVSASEVEAGELVLLDLLHAPEESYLSSLATVMVCMRRLEPYDVRMASSTDDTARASHCRHALRTSRTCSRGQNSTSTLTCEQALP
jgi:hypothetical protein